MPLTNTAKPTSTLTNTARVSFAVTWATIVTSWASETRTWDETSSLIDNLSRPSNSITNIAKP